MFPGAPRTLVVLLALVVGLRLLLALLTPGAIVFSLLKVGLLAFFSWQALHGKENAAKVLSILLLIGAALDGYSLLGAVMSGALWAVAFLALPAFHAGVAAYIFRSQAVRNFFATTAFPRAYAP
jgi:hypothetical protein